MVSVRVKVSKHDVVRRDHELHGYRVKLSVPNGGLAQPACLEEMKNALEGLVQNAKILMKFELRREFVHNGWAEADIDSQLGKQMVKYGAETICEVNAVFLVKPQRRHDPLGAVADIIGDTLTPDELAEALGLESYGNRVDQLLSNMRRE